MDSTSTIDAARFLSDVHSKEVFFNDTTGHPDSTESARLTGSTIPWITNQRTEPINLDQSIILQDSQLSNPLHLPPIANCDKLAELEKVLKGNSPAIEAIRQVILVVAPTRASVLVYGESGTGKELVARAIHELSDRHEQPFIPVNMAAIPNGLAESLLFGHEKGAFTSAIQKQKGWCQAANGGTLFLDEIGDMELIAQPKLLRFLQEGTIQRVGSQNEEKVDARLISATNRDPKELVREGRLREDLFFRIHVVPVFIPPLRDRREDIELLANAFLSNSAKLHHRPIRGFTDQARNALVHFDWPGNVRQLQNAVERMVLFAKNELIETTDIPAEFQTPVRWLINADGHGGNGNGRAMPSASDDMFAVLDELSPFQISERTTIIDALQRADGHIVSAAKFLGLGQATMYRKIKQYAIPHERKRRKTAPK